MKVFRNFILLCLCSFPAIVFGQSASINGPTTAYTGTTYYYGINIDSPYFISASSFSISNSNGSATLVQATMAPTPNASGIYHSSVTFTATFSSRGSATLSVSGFVSTSYAVNVSDATLQAPSISIVTIEYCGATAVFRKLSQPPPGWDYWWETDPNSTSTNLGNLDSLLLYTDIYTTLYIRAAKKDFSVWTDAASLGTIKVNKTPPPPPTVAGNVTEFAGNSATLSVNSVIEAINYDWYNQAGELVNQGRTYQKNFFNTETFYVTTDNGCESAKLPVTITVFPLPNIVVLGGGSADLTQGSLTLTTQAYNNYAWYYKADINQSNTLIATSSTCPALQPGLYTVQAGINNSNNSKIFSPSFRVGNKDSKNYISTNVIQLKGISDPLSVDALPITQKSESIQYIDGLGRVVQTVMPQGSPNKKDIIQPVEFDAFGRETRKYLPYVSGEGNGWFKSDPIGLVTPYTSAPQYNFYQTSAAVSKDNAPYAETIFESSPLNRVKKQGAPGTAWQPDAVKDYTSSDHTAKFDYQTNATGEVLRWLYVPSSNTSPCSLSAKGANGLVYYDKQQLFKTKAKDEQQHEVIEYKDKEGHVVLKRVQVTDTLLNDSWADTYYLYNDFGDLVMVLPPEAVIALLK